MRSEKIFEVCSARLMKRESNTRSRWRPHRHDSRFQIGASVETAPCNRSTIVRNRCPLYDTIVTRRLCAMGIPDRPTAPASPWWIRVAERMIGSIRRECVDPIIVLDEAHLRRILRAYAGYYNDIK